MGSMLGKLVKISVFGESHGTCVGVTIDGFPHGMEIDMAKLSEMLKRRAPSGNTSSTKRIESDEFEILSGTLNGITTGAPICALTRNSDVKSSDYGKFSDIPRPSHADYTGKVRYGGHQDLRGGGHFSGRLTAPVVFAGALCKQYLAEQGIDVNAHIDSVGGFCDAAEISAEIDAARSAGDSVGGTIKCEICGVCAGIGNPMFDTVESRLSAAMFAVPAVKGIEFGMGFSISERHGSEVNDLYCVENGKIQTKTNNNGGILGGITTGMPIVFRVAVKPTPSIGAAQNTLNTDTMREESLIIKGRHDPCIVPRAVPVIEAAAAITMLDMYLEAYGYADVK